jgi:tetratricopeptide (TPR) repeat protein
MNGLLSIGSGLLARMAASVLPADGLARVAATLVEQGRLREALPWLRVVARRRPHLPLAHEALGRVLVALGATDEAERVFAQAAACAEREPAPHRLLGDMALADGRYERAAACFQRALAVEEDDEAYVGLALAMYGLGEARQALRFALRATGQAQIDPAAVAHSIYRPTPGPAAVATREGMAASPETAAAERAFRRAVALAPRDPVAFCNLGACLSEAGYFGEALAPLRAAVALAPADPVARALLAAALHCLDQSAEAVAVLDQGASITHTAA